MIKIKIIPILFLSISLCACGGPGEATPVTTQSSAPTEKESPKPYPFSFVDAHGQWHETTIDPSVPRHTYNIPKFTRDGMNCSYEDEFFYTEKGIDVSSHQGSIDWEKVAAEGYEFAIIRIGFRGYGESGSLNQDEKFEENYRAAKKAGLKLGVYFFSQAIDEQEAALEARFVLDIIDNRPLEFGICYDPESILDAPARTDNVSGQQFTENTKVFCKLISDNGYKPFLYSNMMWEAYQFNMKEIEDIPIWYADYEPTPQTPYHFFMWQYTEKGRVEGIDGDVDLNLLFVPKNQ